MAGTDAAPLWLQWLLLLLVELERGFADGVRRARLSIDYAPRRTLTTIVRSSDRPLTVRQSANERRAVQVVT